MATNDETRRRAQSAVCDAFAPLFSPKGIVAATITIMVATDKEDMLMPVHIVLGLNADVVNAALQFTTDLVNGGITTSEPERLHVPLPVKN